MRTPNPRQFLTPFTSFGFSDAAEKASATVLETKAFGTKRLKSDGHLITEDSVFPNYKRLAALPNGIAVIRTPAYFIHSPPCARFARALGAPRTAHFATPPLGAGAVCFIALFSGPMDKPLLRCSRWEITSPWSRVDW